MRKKIVLFLLLVLFLNLFVFSQEKIRVHKKTIGLVLSGGGSRGYAHIGVLKVLEELHIKPDYITGTSQGALIGALYSLGYSVAEIEEFIKDVNWKTIFSDQQNYVDIPILSKEEFPKLPLRLFFDHSIIPKIPVGLIEGHELQALFSKLAWRSHSYANFDEFPIPFRCVSSDLVSGKPVVFKEGNLATAMRASMSVPALFTPVDKDSMLLVDGGVFRNFPVQECKDMGADFIIGVYAVGNKDEPKKEAINSMLQLISVGAKAFLNDLEKEDIELTDVLIVPELNKYRGVEMKKSKVIAQIGETAARDPKIYKQLKKLASYQKAQLKDSVYEKATQGKHINKDLSEKRISIHSIKVKGCQHTDPKKILKTSGLHVHTQLTSTDVSEAIAKVYKSDDFNKITYQIEKQKTKNNLVLKVYEKEAFQFRIGSQYGLGYGFEGLFSLSYKDFLIHNSQISVKAGMSKSPRVFLDYTYNPKQSKNMAFSIQSYTQYNKIPYSFDYSQTTYKTGYFSEFAFDTKFKLAWSPFKNVSLETSLGNQVIYTLFRKGLVEVYKVEKERQSQTYFSAGVRVNTLNDATFPTKGIVFKADFTHQFLISNRFLSQVNIPKSYFTKNNIYQLQYKHFFLLTRHISIIPSLQLGSMDHKPFFTQSFFIGGVANYSRPNRINFAGLEANERVTDNYFIPGLGVQINLANTWFLQIEGQSLSAVNFKDLSSEVLLLKDNQIRNIQVTVSYKSILGPLSFSLAKNLGNKELMPFVAIGFGF